jgi:hypothetical protein
MDFADELRNINPQDILQKRINEYADNLVKSFKDACRKAASKGQKSYTNDVYSPVKMDSYGDSVGCEYLNYDSDYYPYNDSVDSAFHDSLKFSYNDMVLIKKIAQDKLSTENFNSLHIEIKEGYTETWNIGAIFFLNRKITPNGTYLVAISASW